ncbi:MAG TPA: serine/threonine-protein kinase [Phycisphaerae bacterium]|nr:serine/threonine-protein kinase [Phycisphaerae bacterium]HRW54386.1 serine/threonine-protein kinase [Phycisphaerae bacterium]
MTDSDPSRSARDDATIDLASFGFDETGDAWLDTFRDAQRADPMGRLGDYELLAEIGRGGQGVVYKARRASDDRIVAIKRLIGGKLAPADLRRRFEREMRVAASLDHPNITRAIDIDVIDGHPVIVMEWIDGQPLDVWGRPNGVRRPVADILRLFVDACDAVQHAHIRGVIHRDLKPSNILVTSTTTRDSVVHRPVVLDFGMARLLNPARDDTGATTAGAFLGTLAYAAPEQLSGGAQPADALADVYAMGVMLCETLTGRHPHVVSGSLGDTIRAIQEKTPERPSRVAPGLSRDLDAIVLKALSKTPEHRYQSIDALAADLRRHLAGDPVTARRPGTRYLAGKLIRRHPLAFGASALVFAIVTALASALYVANAREKAALRIARTTSDFLAETLAAAEPDRGGADVTLIEVLAQAGDRARRELADTPEAAAQVHLAIGKTYCALWRWRDAIPHLENAERLLRADPDRDDATFARALTALGRAYTSVKNPQAVSLQREALAIRRALFNEPDALIAESLKELAYALQQATDPPQWNAAEECYEAAIEMFRATLGPDHRETAACLHNYGWMRVRQRRYADSVELYHEAIEIFRRTHQRDDPFYVECLFGYTAQLSVLGRDEENLVVVNELIPRLRASHGEAEVGDLLWGRADILLRLGRFDEADDAFADAFRALREWGQAPALPGGADADTHCDDLLDRLADLPADRVRPVLAFIEEFAHSRVVMGRFDRAETIFDRLETAVSRLAPNAALILATIQEGRADIAIARGENALAEQRYRRALDLADRPGLAFDRKRAWLERQLAVCRIVSPAGADDLARLEIACAKLAEHDGADHRLTRETRSLIDELRLTLDTRPTDRRPAP